MDLLCCKDITLKQPDFCSCSHSDVKKSDGTCMSDDLANSSHTDENIGSYPMATPYWNDPSNHQDPH